MTTGEIVYQHTTSTEVDQVLSDAQRKVFIDFLAAHGIAKEGFVLGEQLVVKRRDGKLWFEARRAVGNDVRTAPVDAAIGCVKQELVVTLLVTPVPFLGAFEREAVESGEMQVTPNPGR